MIDGGLSRKILKIGPQFHEDTDIFELHDNLI